MKDLLINGMRFLTTDEIAEATLEYVTVLNQYHRADTVRFPALIEGREAQTAVALGPSTHLVVIDAPDVHPRTLTGARAAVDELHRRLAGYLDDPI